MRRVGLLFLLGACAARSRAPRDAFVLDGARIPVQTHVVLWNQTGGLDANPGGHFGARPGPARDVVTQVVLHYDVAVTSANCQHILDKRGLSCHFLLDLDGTIYQTLDLEKRAWHAGKANDRSIGIEIANIGAYEDPAQLDAWYERDESGARVAFPPWLRRGALPDAVYRPARPDPVRGKIHGMTLYQYDLTNAQYAALSALLPALAAAFPNLTLDTPDTTTVLPDATAFRGIVAHYHITKNKIDPGPAFEWDRVLRKQP